jgi:hypothetical protein
MRRNHLEVVGEDKRIILKWVLPGAVSDRPTCEHGTGPSCSMKGVQTFY